MPATGRLQLVFRAVAPKRRNRQHLVGDRANDIIGAVADHHRFMVRHLSR